MLEGAVITPVLDRLYCNFRWDILERDWDQNVAVRGSSGAGYEDFRDIIIIGMVPKTMRVKEISQRKRRLPGRSLGSLSGQTEEEVPMKRWRKNLQEAKAISSPSVQCIRAPRKIQPEKQPGNLAACWVLGVSGEWFQRNNEGRSQAKWIKVRVGRQPMSVG